MRRFQAFISYKHAASSRFAENLELALKAYAKPWLERPPAIFRDEKYLKPGADLPGMIERALDHSEFLVYLASSEAAASPWVERELERWCADPERVERLIVVVTDGALATERDGVTINWQQTDVLPKLLRAHLLTVPFFVDLTWAKDEARQTLLDPDYKKMVNLLVAALRGIDPIELSGEEILQHRRNVRLRNILVGTIALLALVVFGFAAVAVTQARSASAQVSFVLAESARRAIAEGLPERAARLAALSAREGPLAVADPTAAPTLAAAAHRSTLVMDFRGHQGRVEGVEVSPDETSLLTWSRDGSARVWNVETGEEIAASRHENWVRGACFDSSGQRVLSWSDDGAVRVWLAADGTEIAASKHNAGVWGATFDTAGERVLSWDKGGVTRVWDAGTGAEIAALKHENWVEGATFDPTGGRVLSWDRGSLQSDHDGAARIWDGATGAEIAASKHEDGVWGALFDAGGERVLSWGTGGVARVWDAATGAEIAAAKHEYLVLGAVFDTAENRVLSWDSNGVVRVWSAATSTEIAAFKHEGKDVGAIFDPSGERVLSWDSQGLAQVWDASTGAEIQRTQAPAENRNEINPYEFSGLTPADPAHHKQRSRIDCLARNPR